MQSNCLDTNQFTILAKQEARLNTAYWLSSLITEKSASITKTPVETSEIKSFERQIKLMLKHVKADIKQQSQDTQENVKQELNFVKKFCQHSIKTKSKRGLLSAIGFPIKGDAEILEQEIVYVREKSDRQDNNILDQHWYKATAILYELLKNRSSSSWFKFSANKDKEQLKQASELYSPNINLIEKECKLFVSQLSLNQFQSLELEEQLTEDYLQMFAAGRALKDIVATTLSIRSGLISRFIYRNKNERLINSVLENLNPAQERLILSCIAKGNTVRRVIDADVID